MKVLVLGRYKSGFLVSNIIEYLKTLNYDVFHSANLDCRDLQDIKYTLDTFTPDIVINAAAYTSGLSDIIHRPWYHINENALMNANVYQACYEHDVKHVIFLSCCVMYNSNGLYGGAYFEEDPIDPDSIETNYLGVASMKIFSENLGMFYSKKYGMKVTIIRHTNTFGPYDHFESKNNHVLPALMNRIYHSTDKIVIWGNPKARKNLIYVKDVCRFIDFSIQNQKEEYEIFNLGGQETSIINLVRMILLISDKKLEIVTDEEKFQGSTDFNAPIIYFDKAKEFGFTNKYTLSIGVRETWNWLKWWKQQK